MLHTYHLTQKEAAGLERNKRRLPFWVLVRELPSSCLNALKMYPALNISTASAAFASANGLRN